jgi:hypothetical protein
MWTPALSVRIKTILLIGVPVGCALILYLRFVPPESPWSPRNIAGAVMPEPRVITKIEKVVVQGPEKIRIIEKEKIREVYRDLPTPGTVADNQAQVICVADIPDSPAGGTAIAVIRPGPDNVATGYIEYQPKKIPFFGVSKTFGVRVGMGTGGLILGEVYARPLRVGPVDIEIRGFVNRDNARGADFGAVALFDYRF